MNHKLITFESVDKKKYHYPLGSFFIVENGKEDKDGEVARVRNLYDRNFDTIPITKPELDRLVKLLQWNVNDPADIKVEVVSHTNLI